jgi:hypothetical protein
MLLLVIDSGYKFSFGVDENDLKLIHGIGWTTQQTLKNSELCYFVEYELYFNKADKNIHLPQQNIVLFLFAYKNLENLGAGGSYL